VTTNAKCIAALEEKSQHGDPSIKTAISFLETAKTGSFKQWKAYLSEDYSSSDSNQIKSKEWWNFLSSNKFQFNLIAEQPSRNQDNKVVYFKSKTSDNNEKILKIHIIKENNEWKIQSVEM